MTCQMKNMLFKYHTYDKVNFERRTPSLYFYDANLIYSLLKILIFKKCNSIMNVFRLSLLKRIYIKINERSNFYDFLKMPKEISFLSDKSLT